MMLRVVKGDPDRTQREWDIRYVASGGGGRRPMRVSILFDFTRNVSLSLQISLFLLLRLVLGRRRRLEQLRVRIDVGKRVLAHRLHRARRRRVVDERLKELLAAESLDDRDILAVMKGEAAERDRRLSRRHREALVSAAAAFAHELYERRQSASGRNRRPMRPDVAELRERRRRVLARCTGLPLLTAATSGGMPFAFTMAVTLSKDWNCGWYALPDW